MYLTIKQELKNLTRDEFETLKELSHTAKNMYNVALYNIRQHFFATGKCLAYKDNYEICKLNENYRILNANMAQQIIIRAQQDFNSFYALLKLKRQGTYTAKVNIPHYLPKEGFAVLEITGGEVDLTGGELLLPYSNAYRKGHARLVITMPKILAGKTVKEIRILPKQDSAYFVVHYTYEADVSQGETKKTSTAGVDLGIDNLMTITTDTGKSLIIDGRRLKSVNQWYNKHNAALQSQKDKAGILGLTKLQRRIIRKRENCVNDYISKACRRAVDYCAANGVGTLVLGWNADLQRGSNIGDKNNQNFVNIPFAKIKNKLGYLCEMYGIALIVHEESYTSKASALDGDFIPVYGDKGATDAAFSGRRVKRGLYRRDNGLTLNADVNGALNIMRKGSDVGLTALIGRGEVDTPKRVRIVKLRF